MADITLTGNTAAAPELRYTPNGRAVATFSVAENHRRKVGDDWQDDGTTWWRITVWGQHAETLAETLGKGQRVLVIGTVRSREWEKDGEQRTSYDEIGRASCRERVESWEVAGTSIKKAWDDVARESVR